MASEIWPSLSFQRRALQFEKSRISAPALREQRLQRRFGARDAQVEQGGDDVERDDQGDRRFRRARDAGVEHRDVEREQVARDDVAEQLAAEHHAEDDRQDRQALDPAVGLDQLRVRQQLGQDAVLGGRVRRGAQADDAVGKQRMGAEQHQQAAHDLDRVRDEHDRALGHRVGEGADQRRQDHVEQREHRRQRRDVPRGRAAGPQQLDGGDEQCVVRQRAEELRRHDRVEAFFHSLRVGGGWTRSPAMSPVRRRL